MFLNNYRGVILYILDGSLVLFVVSTLVHADSGAHTACQYSCSTWEGMQRRSTCRIYPAKNPGHPFAQAGLHLAMATVTSPACLLQQSTENIQQVTDVRKLQGNYIQSNGRSDRELDSQHPPRNRRYCQYPTDQVTARPRPLAP